MSLTSSTSGRIGFSGSFSAGARSASSVVAATSILSERIRAWLSTTPRPIPGKDVELLHSAASEGEPVNVMNAKRALYSSIQLTNFVFLSVTIDRREGTSSSYQGSSICPVVDVLRLRLMQAARVT